MNIQIKKLKNHKNFEVYNTLASWDNDPQIKALIRPRMTEEDLPIVTAQELMYYAYRNKKKHTYLVYDNSLLIGSYTIDTDFDKRIYKKEGTAWFGIIIGEKDYRGKGIGKLMLADIEKECLKLGCKAIELGVFEYNKNAFELYKSFGYQVIATIESFVFMNGNWYSDIRMLKHLE